MQKILGLSIMTLLLVVMLALGVNAERGITASGECGDNLTWTLYSDGELVISGSGRMQDYTVDSNTQRALSPWDTMGIADSIKKVTVEAGVETIGNNAFRQCVNLTEIDISALQINDNAFYGCTALEEVHLSKDVTYITESAFDSCTSLKNIYAERDDSKDMMFYDIDGVLFKKVYTSFEYEGEIYENTNYSFVKYPIGRTDESYVIPEGIKDIGARAFMDCVYIKTVDIPESVYSISQWAFNRCTNLTDVDMKGT